ncbi:MAG TPA: hypothetical protein VGG34_01465 [Opitutaceae bacterium]|jgi:hypothetical protein
MSAIITLGRDEATRDLAVLYSGLGTPEARVALMNVVGVRADKELRAWWTRRDANSPNKHGWTPRQHFWARIVKATAFDPSKTTEATATVVVSEPALSAKIYGATIKPTGAVSPKTGRPTQNISIPMVGAAYGLWPRGNPTPGLFFIKKTHGNGGFLVARDGKGLIFFYRLLPEVTVPKDPQALPPADQLGAALADTANDFFRRNASEGGVS